MISEKGEGFLIDLDHAVGEGSSDILRRTGTMEFMAIEILRGSVSHTWRHDLESFFYVLIWILIKFQADGTKRTDNPEVTHKWSFQSAADAKYTQMSDDREFQKVLENFSTGFSFLKEMVRKMRDILFPASGRGIFVGTQDEHAEIYMALINVLEEYTLICE